MAEDENTQQDEGTQETDTATKPEKSGKSEPEGKFTQADLDRIVKERLERQKKSLTDELTDKYADYDELRQAAAEWQKAQDAKKSDVERWQDAIKKLEEEKAEQAKSFADLQAQYERAEQERIEALIRAEIVAQATVLGFTDPHDAYRLLDLTAISLGDDGAVGGVDDQLKKLAEAKPYLLQQHSTQPRTVRATNLPRGRDQGETDAEKRARLWGGGDAPFGKHGGGVFMPEKPQ